MPFLCAAVGCNNRSHAFEHISFHRFPLSNQSLLQLWLHNMGRVGFVPTVNHRLCSDHFAPECFETISQAVAGCEHPKRRLNAVPTLFARTVKRLTSDNEDLLKSKRVCREHQVDASTVAAAVVQPMQVQTCDMQTPLLQPLRIMCDASTQTEMLKWRSTSTQTVPRMKDVGMWAKPESTDRAVSCSLRTDASSVSTGTSPFKQPPPIFSQYDHPEQDHPYAAVSHSQPNPVPVSTSDSVTTSQSSAKISSSNPTPICSQDYITDEILEESEESSESQFEDLNCWYLVSSASLWKLMRRCLQCGDVVHQVTKTHTGSLLTVSLLCDAGHTTVWNSQPKLKQHPEGNVMLCAAVLFAGATYCRFHQICQFIRLQVPSERTFFRIQENFLYPAVHRAWLTEKEKIQEELQTDEDVRLIGDARCDSPGYSAKYGTYTLMHSPSNKIVDFEVVQVSEVKSSHAMELEGFKRTLQRVLDADIPVKVVATDRHVSINKEMDRSHPDLIHQFDVWHFAKNIRKRLSEKAKLKQYADLQPWIQSITNHLWWSSATCDGDAKLLKEKWISVLHHVANSHSWETCELFHECEHPPLSDEQMRRKKWLKAGSPSHVVLQSVVLDKQMLAAMDKLTLFCHTGSLEVYHSLHNKYVPKRQHFSFHGMLARTMLSALDNNSNVGREQAAVTSGPRKGEPRFSVLCPKGRKGWIARPVYQPKSYDYVHGLMDDVRHLCVYGTVDDDNFPHRDLPRNIATEEKPPKEEVICQHRSRFDAK